MRYNQTTQITLDPSDIKRLENPEIGIITRGTVTVLYNPNVYEPKGKGKKST